MLVKVHFTEVCMVLVVLFFFLCSVCFLQVFNVPIFIIPINLNGPKILSLNFCTSPTSLEIYPGIVGEVLALFFLTILNI